MYPSSKEQNSEFHIPQSRAEVVSGRFEHDARREVKNSFAANEIKSGKIEKTFEKSRGFGEHTVDMAQTTADVDSAGSSETITQKFELADIQNCSRNILAMRSHALDHTSDASLMLEIRDEFEEAA